VSLSFGFNQVELSGGDAWMSEPDMRKCMTGVRDIGASDIRMACVWQFIESARGQFNWGALDRAVDMARSFGLAPTLVVQFPPPGWSAAAGDFGNFAKAVAARYGSAGTNQVANFEIMNEMNNILNLAPPTPQQYTPYLKAAYLGIKSVYPTGSNVITGGVMACYGGFFTTGSYYFCKTLYETGCKGYFDTMGFHWYSNTDQFVLEKPTTTQTFLNEMQGVRDAMVANGDSAKPIWVTEMGFAYPTVASLTTCRDWMKAQVDILNGLSWVGKWFIYNYRNSGTDIGNVNNQWGVTDFNFVKKQPLWDYVASLNPAAPPVVFTGSGALGAKVSRPVSAGFGGSGSLSASVSVRVPVTASFSGAGSLDVDVYGHPAAKFGGAGDLSATVRTSFPVTAAFTGTGTLVVGGQPVYNVNAQFTGTGTLSATSAQERFYEHTFVGSTKPTTFTDFGAWSYYVSSGMALPGNPGYDGFFYTGAIYNLDQLSPNHYAEITLGNAGVAYDRSSMPLVRANPSGTDWVGATMRFGGASGVQIITSIGGSLLERSSGPINGYDGDRLGLRAEGNVFTVYKNGEPTSVVWTDISGIASATNVRTGIGFQHARSGGAMYGTQGIRHWVGQDLYPTPTPPSVVAAFSGAGALSAVITRKASAAFGGAGSLSALIDTPGGRTAPFTGTGTLTATAYAQLSVTAPFGGVGTLTAGASTNSVAPTFGGTGTLSAAATTFTPFTVENTNVVNEVIPAGTSGCWVTLVGAGGGGGKGFSGGTGTTRTGGKGGGGGAQIPEVFIPVANLGSTYSTSFGTGGAGSTAPNSAGGTGGSSTFSSGSVALTATGGGGGTNTGSAGGGTATQTGVPSAVLNNGTATRTDNPNGAAAGGGNGASITSGNVTTASTVGGSSATVTASGTSAQPDAAAGEGGCGGRGGSIAFGTGGKYGGGGGGSSGGSTPPNGFPGGVGYSRIRWV
jgi:hypothetical protein